MVTLHEQACWLCYTYPTKQVLGAHWSGMKLMWLMDWIKSTHQIVDEISQNGLPI